MENIKYKKISERKKGEIYHKWVKENGFIEFTKWETKVLKGKIIIN